MNKYLRTVASVGFLFTLNYDARNNELKKKKGFSSFQNQPDCLRGPSSLLFNGYCGYCLVGKIGRGRLQLKCDGTR